MSDFAPDAPQFEEGDEVIYIPQHASGPQSEYAEEGVVTGVSGRYVMVDYKDGSGVSKRTDAAYLHLRSKVGEDEPEFRWRNEHPKPKHEGWWWYWHPDIEDPVPLRIFFDRDPASYGWNYIGGKYPAEDPSKEWWKPMADGFGGPAPPGGQDHDERRSFGDGPVAKALIELKEAADYIEAETGSKLGAGRMHRLADEAAEAIGIEISISDQSG